jgi:hypothetical protein
MVSTFCKKVKIKIRLGWFFVRKKTLLNYWLIWLIISNEQAICPAIIQIRGGA